MKIIQSRSFERRVKRFRTREKKILDTQIQRISENPVIGQEKKGDLCGIYVYKFKVHTLQYLLSYRIIDRNIPELIMIGPHENYYRDLKNYLDNR